MPGGRWGPVQIALRRFGGQPIPVEGRNGGSSADHPEVMLNDYANAPPEARTSRRLVYIYTAWLFAERLLFAVLTFIYRLSFNLTNEYIQ